MSSIDTDLRLLLTQQPSISDICADRIYNEKAEQGAAQPYVVLTDMNENPLLALDGTYGLAFRDYDIDCYAASFPKARDLAAAIKAFLDDYTGAAGASTIQAVIYQDQSSGYVEPEDGGRMGLFVKSLEFQIQYT